MPEVRVRTGRFTRREKRGESTTLVRYGVGDKLTVSDRELQKLGSKVERLDGGSVPVPPKVVTFDVKTADVNALKAKAEELGIEVDSRWGEKRLREEVAAELEELAGK